MLTGDRQLPIIDIQLQDRRWIQNSASKALLDSGANANFVNPTTLGECEAFNYISQSTNTRLSLALNAITSSEESSNVVVRSDRNLECESAVVNKNLKAKLNLITHNNKMVNEQFNADTTVRLLINHLNTDDTTGDSPGQRTISLNTKVTIHLSITTPMGNPIKITCDAYVANIRYPLILGYPTLKQYDLCRQLPSFWSSNDQVGHTTDQGLLGYAKRHISVPCARQRIVLVES